MEFTDTPETLLATYLETFDPLIGDQRTGRAFRGTVQGIIGAESLVCSRIAVFSPSVGNGEHQRSPVGAPPG